ncbi:MAG: hypothetical protein CGU28_13175 [Candidatus Dactylopiibacterium carminicum]|uniref:DUF3299 domain-containing protein n=1 Tax=Candidatus Dactylopiibacterium carminicum TaxID=857335 RepID=A0A272EP55_9RHOO|nr:hypothetical protein [Candidatus Dactylopiibacterium carminicum]KAF7598290.1 hypothetical protein BGI27_14160 [Candidatus Dactylopiibacterium carminicum]PAS91912.1 MAG: hypothetical protein CGU29_13865 [Candidatus Dactylopiibacterium carminicum]PAS94968.1 MAG: hypothetical protein CGU28_13175 [Candidatus Dactylopiibacterium carminicum]PAS97222.1 MAG: hypothetical protein BSR46_14190 [Candidatus Dactylopiibacterium carminicum]
MPLPVRTGGTRRRFLLALSALAASPLLRAAELLRFDGLYKSNTVLGLQFAERTLALKGETVRLRGYMAPPLKPESNFFVLTREPVAICPFCSSDAEWPVDIVVIYASKTVIPTSFSERIEVEGKLEVGSYTDPVTGFVSQLRIRDAVFHRIT